MNLHFPLPKIRTIGDELFLAKSSHFSFLPSRFPSLPSQRGHHCGPEIRNDFTFSIAKIFFALFVPPPANGTSPATSDRKPKTNDQILPSPILFFPPKKWIKLIPKTIGNRKRDCAWGGSRWSTLPEKIYRSQSTNLEGVRSVYRTDLCFAICRFCQVRPCASFSMFLVTFFSPNLRGRAEIKQNAQCKKKHWLSVPGHLAKKWQTELIVLRAVILLFIFYQTMIELNSFQSPRKFDFSLYLTFLRAGWERSRICLTKTFINIANAFVLPRSLVRWEARTRFRFQTKHLSWCFLSK